TRFLGKAFTTRQDSCAHNGLSRVFGGLNGAGNYRAFSFDVIARMSLSCGVLINQINGRWSLLAMVTTNGIHMAHAEPDGVERGKESKRQHRADGSASDQHISHGSPEH